ncbi:RNA methyltransferase [Phenylobacterium sp.]|uniref:TrmH family RNA methyltransferase n=1 Tax=Phenylobacterium sp. TaxID=1871053 RepID=UPI00271E3B00|nr:RNA methyltransferase [Phenylobacterium sp.]MDO8381187.1 RNA methyltransferase [Phenylobacterium sp.]
MIIPIDDPADPRVAAYRDVRERDLVGREGLFVAEGEVVLNVLARSTLCEPISLMIAQKRVAGLAHLLEQLPDDLPVYAASQAAMDAVVGFPIHRGILALGRRRDPPSARDMLAGLGEGALVLALSGIANHDNMGGLFRNAAAFGADAVLLDADCCDPLYRKAIRVSVGAALATPFAWAKGDLLDLLEEAGFEAVALSPSGATRLADLKRASRTAVLLGAEGPGLPASVLARTTTVAIPMATGFDSLNVATTAGIVLHHLAFAAERL